MNLYFLLLFLASTLISFYAYKIFIPFSIKNNLLDIPISRSAHSNATPTSGGLIFSVITIISTIFIELFFTSHKLNILILSTVPIILISYIDDFRSINIKIRYRLLLQVLTSIFLVNYGNIYIFDGKLISVLIYIFLIFVSITTINVSNFIDGLDGLLVSSILIIFLTSAYILEMGSPILLILLGSLLAFLFYNHHPAKIFMGDVGSIFLGSVYVGLAFFSKDFNTLISILLLGTPLYADTLTTILRRFINSENIFTAHKLQIFQRLHQAGWGQRKITNLYCLLISSISLSLILFGFWAEIFVSFLSILVIFYIDKKYAKPFLKC